jgi:outer membrane protein TolC
MRIPTLAQGLAGLALAVAALGTAHAAESLTLERALVLADESNPRLRAAAAQTEGARAGIRTARASQPDLDAAAGRSAAARTSWRPRAR